MTISESSSSTFRILTGLDTGTAAEIEMGFRRLALLLQRSTRAGRKILQDSFSLHSLRLLEFLCSVACGEYHISLSLYSSNSPLDRDYFHCSYRHTVNVTR